MPRHFPQPQIFELALQNNQRVLHLSHQHPVRLTTVVVMVKRKKKKEKKGENKRHNNTSSDIFIATSSHLPTILVPLNQTGPLGSKIRKSVQPLTESLQLVVFCCAPYLHGSGDERDLCPWVQVLVDDESTGPLTGPHYATSLDQHQQLGRVW